MTVSQRVLRGLTVLGLLTCVVLGAGDLVRPAAADEGDEATEVGRFQILEDFLGGSRDIEEQLGVVDTATGRIYMVHEDGAMTIDPVDGRLATKVPERGEVEAAEPRGWGELAQRTGPSGRFELYESPGTLALFDTATGRAYALGRRLELVTVLDPVAGRISTREVSVEDAAGMLRRAGRNHNEAAAIGALKTINVAQSLFREGDKERDQNFDYGTLAELSEAELVDSVLGSGRKNGYLFEVRYSPQTSEFLWMATANPEEPGVTGRRYFVTNQAGVIFYSLDAPFEITDDCQVPERARPVGR